MEMPTRYTLVSANNEPDFLEELNAEISEGANIAEFHYDFRLDVDENRKHIARCEMFIALLEWKGKQKKTEETKMIDDRWLNILIKIIFSTVVVFLILMTIGLAIGIIALISILVF